MTNTLPYRYSPPVDRLLNYGDCLKMREWPNYLELGLTAQHVPELIRMATDEDLHFAATDSLEVWAPVHAWRALGQLRAESAIKPLLELLASSDGDIEDDWTPEELPHVFAEIGPVAIPDLTDFLADDQYGVYSRTAAANGLQQMAEKYSEVRDEVVAILIRQLEQFDDQEENFNAFLISALADLKASEALPVIEQAFAADAVEEFVMGDWEDVQIEFGLKIERETPRPNYFLESFPPEPEELLQAIADETKRLSLLDRKAAKKEKAKREQAKKMRKKNRKR
jgi:HEAT repeat protein